MYYSPQSKESISLEVAVETKLFPDSALGNSLCNRLSAHLAPSLAVTLHYIKEYTLPTAEILSGKNARAWVSMDFT